MKCLPITALVVCAALTASCVSPPKPLEQQQAEMTTRWHEVATHAERPIAELTWSEAAQRMERDNPRLRQAREAVRAGEEAVRQVPHNYIPELSLNLFAYPTVQTIGNGQLGDTFFFLGTLITLPDPVRYRAEALQARLQFLSAQVDAELLRRDLHVRLYRVFRKASRLARQDSAQHALREIASGQLDSPAAREAELLAEQSRAAWRTIEPELAELIGDYSAHWRPLVDASLPELDYAAHPPPLDPKSGFATLQITKAALQLAALDAQRQGMLTMEWPQASVFLSAPPIYQRSAGRESYLSFRDVRVSGFLAYSTDLRGTRALARRQAGRRTDLVGHELDLAMQGTLTRLQDGLTLLQETQARSSRLREAEAALRKAGAVVDAALLHQQADDLAQEIDDLNLSFWVLDDHRWQPSP